MSAGLAVDHGLERSAGAGGDHSEAACLGLDGDDAEVFDPEEEQGSGRAIQIANLLVGVRMTTKCSFLQGFHQGFV